MSDFLTNLVVKNLEPATEIKPRLSSLYEPPPLAGGILSAPISGPIFGPTATPERGSRETNETEYTVSTIPDARFLTERQRRAQSLESNRAARLASSLHQQDDESDAITHVSVPDLSQSPSSFIHQAFDENNANWSSNQPSQIPAKPLQHEAHSQTLPSLTEPPSQSDAPTRHGPEKSKLMPATARDEARAAQTPLASTAEQTDAAANPSPAQSQQPLQPAPTKDARRRLRALDAEDSHGRDESDSLDQQSAQDAPRPAIAVHLTPRLPAEEVSARGERDAPAGVLFRPQVTRKTDVDAPGPAAAPEAAPIINVTIGRIEVRATSATESRSRPQRQQTSSTSLDEYLRQRAQGVKR
jgi:hypothetical protein